MSRAFLDGSFGGMSIDTDALPSMQEIAEHAKANDPKLYREIIRRGWIERELAQSLAPYAPTSARSTAMDGDEDTGTTNSNTQAPSGQNTGSQSAATDQGEGSETGADSADESSSANTSEPKEPAPVEESQR